MSRPVLRLFVGLDINHNIALTKKTGLKNARLIIPSNLPNLRVTLRRISRSILRLFVGRGIDHNITLKKHYRTKKCAVNFTLKCTKFEAV